MSRQNSSRSLNSSRAAFNTSRRSSLRTSIAVENNSGVSGRIGTFEESNEVEDLDLDSVEPSTFIRRLENQLTIVPDRSRARLRNSSAGSDGDDGPGITLSLEQIVESTRNRTSSIGAPDEGSAVSLSNDDVSLTLNRSASFDRKQEILVADLPLVRPSHKPPALPKLPDDRIRRIQTAIVSTREAREQLGSAARLILAGSEPTSWSDDVDFTQFGAVASTLNADPGQPSNVLELVNKIRENTAVAFSASESQRRARDALRRARLQQNVKHLQEQRDAAIKRRAAELGCVREADIRPDDEELASIYQRFDAKIELFYSELVKIGPPSPSLTGLEARESVLRKTVYDLRLPACMNVKITSSCFDALALMIKNNLERLPVLDAEQSIVGVVTMELIRNMNPDAPVFEALRFEPVSYHFHEVKFSTTIGAVWQYFEDHPNSAAYVIHDNNGFKQLRVFITKSDLWQAEREEEVLPISTAEAQAYTAWFTMALMLLYPVVLIGTLVYSGEFLNFSVNPYFGPSQRMLIYVGAKSGQSLIVEHSYWRLIAANWIHAGIIHVAVVLFLLSFFCMPFERFYGTMPTIITYGASGVLGYMVSTLALPNSVGCGATPSIMGMVGASLLTLFHDWRERPEPIRELLLLIAAIVLLVLAGFLPDLDNFAHLSALLCGFVTATLVLKSITFGINRLFVVFLSALLLAAAFVTTFAYVTMTKTTEDQCEFCVKYRCFNIMSWCDHVQ
eukprot:TRINITY_DN11375_c0_g1_i1.p1 TRINITY_DN11375_c0_g1~~TRINITY_DN11375_c0_g1_i1.p1  ORF type:complete len:774 (+),score=94.97 TRINITY_DN11375_c0_g1_i1:122-2323(+)